ncbi:hypothetical protein [Streptomyces sp. NPDC056600]|uniref:hypothetical protein n=1 Tax=Streptomyces sp. NPDC056600 TaxID=3345874 RepID=UPI0036CE73BA
MGRRHPAAWPALCGAALMVTITGCGASDDTAKAPAPSASKPEASAPVKDARQVKRDVRFATAGLDAKVDELPSESEELCRIDAFAVSEEVPGEAELRAVVDRLVDRGWKVDNKGGEVSTDGTFLTAGVWRIITGADELPKELQRKTKAKGGLVVNASGPCDGKVPERLDEDDPDLSPPTPPVPQKPYSPPDAD